MKYSVDSLQDVSEENLEKVKERLGFLGSCFDLAKKLKRLQIFFNNIQGNEESSEVDKNEHNEVTSLINHLKNGSVTQAGIVAAKSRIGELEKNALPKSIGRKRSNWGDGEGIASSSKKLK